MNCINRQLLQFPLAALPLATRPLVQESTQSSTSNSCEFLSFLCYQLAFVARFEQGLRDRYLGLAAALLNRSPGTSVSFTNSRLYRSSCVVTELNDESDLTGLRSVKSKLRQILERVRAFVIRSFLSRWVIYLYGQECQKVRVLQDECIAFDQRRTKRDSFWSIERELSRSIDYCELITDSKKSEFEKQRLCFERLFTAYYTVAVITYNANFICKLVENEYRKAWFRPNLIRRLNLMKKRGPY